MNDTQKLKEVGFDIFINSQHILNPFARKQPQFFVRVIAIKNEWVAYQTFGGSIKYMTVEGFNCTFERPDILHSEVVKYYSNISNDTCDITFDFDNEYAGYELHWKDYTASNSVDSKISANIGALLT